MKLTNLYPKKQVTFSWPDGPIPYFLWHISVVVRWWYSSWGILLVDCCEFGLSKKKSLCIPELGVPPFRDNLISYCCQSQRLCWTHHDNLLLQSPVFLPNRFFVFSRSFEIRIVLSQTWRVGKDNTPLEPLKPPSTHQIRYHVAHDIPNVPPVVTAFWYHISTEKFGPR